MVQEKPIDPFSWIGETLREIAQRERANHEGYDTIEEAIDPREIDAVQELRRAMRRQGLAKDSEKAYVGKLKAFMDENVSPSSQGVAFNALKKFFTAVLKRDMGEINAIRASKGKMVPTVMSSQEVRDVLAHLEGVQLVVAKLLYGCGLRISEAVRLRVKDIDFDHRLIEIHKSKGDKSLVVTFDDTMPQSSAHLRYRYWLGKDSVTFSDMIISVRHHLWCRWVFERTPGGEAVQKLTMPIRTPIDFGLTKAA